VLNTDRVTRLGGSLLLSVLAASCGRTALIDGPIDAGLPIVPDAGPMMMPPGPPPPPPPTFTCPQGTAGDAGYEIVVDPHGPNVGSDISMSAASDGTVYLAWAGTRFVAGTGLVDDQLHVAARAPDGRIAPLGVLGRKGVVNWEPSVVAREGGALDVVWTEDSSTAASHFDGRSWTSLGVISSTQFMGPNTAAVGPDGTLWVAVAIDLQTVTQFWKSTPTGFVQVGSDRPGLVPKLTRGSDGTLYAAFEVDSSAQDTKTVAVLKWVGSDWQELPALPAVAHYMECCDDAELVATDRIVVTTASPRQPWMGGGWDVGLRSWLFTGGAWSELRELSNGLVPAFNAAVTLGPDGTAFASFTVAPDPFQASIVVTHVVGGQTETWLSAFLGVRPAQQASSPVLRVDAAGSWLMAYAAAASEVSNELRLLTPAAPACAGGLDAGNGG
jgi:hypothetical protein